MSHFRNLRLTIAMTILMICCTAVPGIAGSSSPAGAQERPQSDLLGFAAELPGIYDQIGLISSYGFHWLTPENAMKMETIGGCNGNYNFGPTDELLEIANRHRMQVHGHTLIWHRQTSWCAGDYTQQDMRTYIQTVTGYYCGRIPSIDVVNEALGKYTGYRTPGESVWRSLSGDNEYIINAFAWARESCPEMKLYYNDFDIEFGPKAVEMLDLVRTLNERDLIDGVGFQSHLKMGEIDVPGFAATMDAIVGMGLEFSISELDIRWGRNYWELSDADFNAQAGAYRQVAELCNSRPECVRFTTWGVDDGSSWVNHWWEFGPYDDAPLLFDRFWLPKPAYCAGVRPVFDLPQGACAGG